MMSGGFGIPGLGMFLFWGLIIFLVIFLVRGLSRNASGDPQKSAREVLDERFAQGEIDRDEYEERKKALV